MKSKTADQQSTARIPFQSPATVLISPWPRSNDRRPVWKTAASSAAVNKFIMLKYNASAAESARGSQESRQILTAAQTVEQDNSTMVEGLHALVSANSARTPRV